MNKKKNRILFWIINGMIALVVLIFIIQNWHKVTFNLLGLKIEGFGFLVFLVIFLLGFVSGGLWEHFRSRKKGKNLDQYDNVQDSLPL